MISRRQLLASAAATGTTVAGLAALAPAAAAAPAQGLSGAPAASGAGAAHRFASPVKVEKTTVEYAENPLGLDARRPRLSWTLGSDERDQAQSAYQVRVATSARGLTSAHADPDVWDSGKVTSHRSVLVAYDGPALQPRSRYHWSVRVWDARGRVSGWSTPAWWETGLVEDGQWTAKWITAPASLSLPPDLAGASWIWFPEGDPTQNAPAATRWFRGTVEPAGAVRQARLVMTADDGFTAWVNGTEVGGRDSDPDQENWRRPLVVDVTSHVRAGENTLAVAATNGKESPAGLLGSLELTYENDDEVHSSGTGEGWRTTDAEPSDDAWTQPGYDDGSWTDAKVLAAWGAGPWGKVSADSGPFQMRRDFRLATGKGIARARLYTTALGLYEAHINGRRVGSDQLAPGWTDYHHRVQYQTYDVTKLLRRGANAVGMHLAPGWYAGHIASFGPHQYGEQPGLLAQLEVTYTDGSTDTVTTDPGTGTGTGWQCAVGPVRYADLIMGEEYDARAETPGWAAPGFDAAGWLPAVAAPDATAAVQVAAQTDAPTRIEQELKPVGVTEPRPGVFVFDLGQNMVGSVRLRVSGGTAGQTVQLRHAEVLNPDGTVYTANLRTARATDTYTLKGSGTSGKETYEPRFTFHGFRYVEVTGYPGKPPRSAVTGRVMHTAAPFTMAFETDVPMLNQLHRNITWGQRGNFLSVPTDTPARDERLGWTGDINVFSATAAYTMESARFLTKWLRDLRDGQTAEGGFPDVAPYIGPVGNGAAGWGDAGVTVPWNLYQAYGDRQVLADSFPAMKAWLGYLEQHSTGGLRPAEGYGDWLNVSDETPKDVVATAYFAYAAALVARAARALDEDPKPHEELAGRVRDAFNTAYVTAAGSRIKGDTQTAYVLALSMDLLPEGDARTAAADRLVELIQADDWHLSTGFLGTPRLLPALTAAGHTDVAYRLLQQRTFPSWGYQIDKGATTMWERWDSIKPDGTFQDASMNSFNHYAYGSVGEWMYQNITGISPGEPGFHTIVVRPRPGGDVRSATGRYDSVYGPVTTDWSLKSGTFTLEVSVPVNTTAEVWMPARRASAVSLKRARGARFLRMEDGCAVYATGSGTHRFSAPDR